MSSKSHSLPQLIQRLKLPALDLAQLSFCHSVKPAKVQSWIDQLPLTRINHSSVVLYKALPEVSRLKTSADNRLAILEALRYGVQQCILGLASSFLDQPLVLPEKAMKTAIIGQALQKHMTNGYCQVVKDLLDKRPKGNFKAAELQQLTLALHRAITGLGLQFLRNSQIYTQVSSQLWLELNTLYLIAEQLKLQKHSAEDATLKHSASCTIEQAYSRTLLLACASPNQLQQQELNQVFEALEEWSRSVQLQPTEKALGHLFMVDTGDGFPPGYSSQWSKDASRPQTLRVLDMSELLEQLRNLQAGHSQVDLNAKLNPRLRQHLFDCWSSERQRQQPRQLSQSPLQVVVGLTPVHYHLAQHTPFDQFVQNGAVSDSDAKQTNQVAPPSPRQHDPWGYAPDAAPLHTMEVEELTMDRDSFTAQRLSAPSKPEASSTSPEQSLKYPIHTVKLFDVSEGGYCISWQGEIPLQVKAGELIALKEQNQLTWSLGVIRWAMQQKGSSRLGIKLIAQQVVPAAAQLQHHAGAKNVYMRAFMANAGGYNLDQPVLITPAVPFREGGRALVKSNQKDVLLYLSRAELASASINAFSYRHLDQSATTT